MDMTRCTPTRRWWREPLVHFLAAGFVLFLIGRWLEPMNDDYRIVVTPQRRTRLAERYALQFGRPPDTATLAELVDHDIEEEIMYRHGIALGLDRDDEIVRRRIVQKVQFLMQDISVPAEPSETQLAAYFETHTARYTTPVRVTFSHVYFSVEKGEPAARRRAEDAWERIAGGAPAMDLGDPFPDLYHFSAFEPDQIHRLFGHSEFSTAALSAPIGRWSGPYRSSYGWHLIHIESRESEKPSILADVHDRVRSDYLLDARADTNRTAFDRLAREYRIVRHQP